MAVALKHESEEIFVTASTSSGAAYRGVVTSVTRDRIEVVGSPWEECSLFVWLEMTLPRAGERIKALGQVEINEDRRRVIRFKHLFPDQRRKLEACL